jgi:cytosine/adenosine deaminase-related metal-dependent hydrolase
MNVKEPIIRIKNPLLIARMDDNQSEIPGGEILIHGTKILAVNRQKTDTPAKMEIDAYRMVLLPGFINTHHHLFQTLTRNIPYSQNLSLFRWLESNYEIWRELTAEGIYISAMVGLAELMKSGCTTSSDHLYLFNRKSSSHLIDMEIQAARELGIRFQPTRGSMSLGKSRGGLPPDDTVQSEEEIMKDSLRLIKKYHNPNPGAMIRISLAPCSPFSVTRELMKKTVLLAREHDLQIHTHLAETLDEERFCLEKYKMRPVSFIHTLGWINPNAWFAHMVHLSSEEIKILGENRVGVSHCPTSNMRLGSGIARVKEMLDSGMSVGLGVDGSASNDAGNMFSEIRNAMLLSRLRKQPYWLTARDVLWIATRGGAAALGREDIGEISPGKQADIIGVRLDRLEYAGGIVDPLAAIVFGVAQSPVDFLMSNGKILIQNGKSLNIDEMSLVQRQNEIAKSMLENARKNSGIDFFHEQPPVIKN